MENNQKDTKIKSNNKKYYLIIIITTALLLIGGVIWYFYTKGNNSTNTNNFVSNRSANIGFIRGQISQINGNSIVVNNSNNNGQTIIIISSTTKINKTISDSQNNVLKLNSNIIVQGSRTSTTITAQKIILNDTLLKKINNNKKRFNGKNRYQSQSSTNPLNANNYAGTISNIDQNNLTIKTFSGIEYNVQINNSTSFYNLISGSITDLEVDKTITASGLKDQSGSIEARNISIE